MLNGWMAVSERLEDKLTLVKIAGEEINEWKSGKKRFQGTERVKRKSDASCLWSDI